MKKAFRYNDEIVFYFDAFDNKYIAKGGSLASRLNNPGLVLSRNLAQIGYHAIGAYHHYAIFSHPTIGKEALRAWFISSKYYYSPIIELPKYYQPRDPNQYLQQLHEFTGFSADTMPSTLSSMDLDKLLKAIHHLAGFSPENQHHFLLLPKISARFYSKSRKVEFYLAGNDHLLKKQHAIEWVEMHKLDAVIVHKSTEEVYLRSRPGHHLNQIHFKQEQYGPEKEFEHAVKEVGQFKEGQCIWGFINGISNSASQALKSATVISKFTGDQHVLYLINNAGCLGNLTDVAIQKIEINNQIVKFGAQFFKMLIELADASPSKPPIVILAHSQGALIAYLALKLLKSEEKNRIRVFTLGGAAFISPGDAHSDSHNYFSVADPVPRLTSYDFFLLILRLHEAKKMGLSQEQIIEHLIQEDFDKHFTTHDPQVIDNFRKKRQEHYENELQRSRNVTLIDNNISGTWEHCLAIPSYQSIVREIIDKFHREGVKK